MILHLICIIICLCIFEPHLCSYSIKVKLNQIRIPQHKITSQLNSYALLATASDNENEEKKSIGSSIDKNRLNGQGEWEDWENDSHIDDEYVMDDDNAGDSSSMTSSTLFQLMKESMISQNGNLVMNLMNKIEDKALLNDKVITKSTDTTMIENTIQVIDTKKMDSTSNKSPPAATVRDADYWKGWTEEAPYFDEYDVQDDEGNWGRSDETLDNKSNGFQSNSSDLWNRYYPVTSDTISSRCTITASTESICSSSSNTINPTSTTTEGNQNKDNLYNSNSNDLNKKVHISNSESLLILIQMQELERRIDSKLAYITMTLDTLKSSTVVSNSYKTSERVLILPNLSSVIVYMLMFSCIQYIVNYILSKL